MEAAQKIFKEKFDKVVAYIRSMNPKNEKEVVDYFRIWLYRNTKYYTKVKLTSFTNGYRKAIYGWDEVTLRDFTDEQRICSEYYSPYDGEAAFTLGLIVCEGYSRAVAMICKEFNIVQRMQVGLSNEGVPHAWNHVKCDGEWYHIDFTGTDGAGLDLSWVHKSEGMTKEVDADGYTHYYLPSGEEIKPWKKAQAFIIEDGIIKPYTYVQPTDEVEIRREQRTRLGYGW